MTAAHLSPGGGSHHAGRGRGLPRLLVVLAVVAASLGAWPGSGDSVPAAGAQDSDEIAAARAELTARLDAATAELAAIEAELAETSAQLVATETTLVETRAAREAAIEAREAATEEREEPLQVRRAIAIQVYMAGDPSSSSLIEEVLQANASLEGVRDRALYSSVVDWADEEIARLDGEIAELSREIEDHEEAIPELEVAVEELSQGQRDQLVRRDELDGRVDELAEELAMLNRSPLTGLPRETLQDRPVLIVKIDNVGPARPQHGLNAADIVIEEKVESGLTRFAAMFQSADADPVGPVRSARTSDVHLFANMGAPLFGYSGANVGVGGAVASSNMVDVGANRASGAYWRSRERRAPHNLYTRTSSLWAAAEGGAPMPVFEYRAEDEGLPAGARESSGVHVRFGSATAGFSWNGSGWVRESDGRRHTDASGDEVAPENVVIRFTRYVPSPADARSPEAVVTGSGEMWAFTAGHVVVGRWEQASPTAPTRWLDADGEPLRLTPGRTWIVMPEPGRADLR